MLIEDIKYLVDWGDLTRGKSFFIPCRDGKAAKAIAMEEIKSLNYKALVKVVVEDGIRGLRIWGI